jgi:hypothetical protein
MAKARRLEKRTNMIPVVKKVATTIAVTLVLGCLGAGRYDVPQMAVYGPAVRGFRLGLYDAGPIPTATGRIVTVYVDSTGAAEIKYLSAVRFTLSAGIRAHQSRPSSAFGDIPCFRQGLQATGK